MVLFRERLWPSPWLYLSTALIIPATLIVFAPISLPVGVTVAILLYAAIVAVLLASSALIEVTDTTLRAGRAHIARAYLGRAVIFSGEEATQERGVRLDARAWLLIRSSVASVVKIPIEDPDDAVPYWLISCRRPRSFAAALNRPAPSER
jgi:hypothetical protein